MKFPPLSRVCGLLLLTWWSSSGWAEQADRDQPMNVEADALRYDDAKQVSVFSGRVVLTKGTIQIRGGKIEVRQDPQGYQYGVVTAEPGKLAFFRQKREGLDEFIEGEAQLLEYDSRADTVKLITQAQLRRYVGARLNDDFKASVIVYNNLTEVFTLDGAPAPGQAPGQAGALNGARVRATLTPKPPAAHPAAAASAPVLPLREAPALKTSRP